MLDEILKSGKINGFPDEELIELIEIYKKEDSEDNFVKVAKKLDETHLLVPLSFDNNEITGLFLIENPNDKKYYMMAFTSPNEYKLWEKESKKESITFMVETLANIMSILKDEKNITANGLVIDPYGICISVPKEVLNK